jgi:hypothetical protein
LNRPRLGLFGKMALTTGRPMSERSIYLRDQADKCRQHANMVGDARTREELRKLAAVYTARAVQIECKEPLGPSNAFPNLFRTRMHG